MSANGPPPFPDEKTEKTRSVRKRLHVEELDSIDKRLKRLKDEVLPFSPYLLTVPTSVPFRLGNRVVNNWAVGKDGPFAPEEQQLQYMTFLTHQEGDTLLVAMGDWSNKSGSIMTEDESKPPSIASAASTPLSNSTKKKISLSDYKSKAKSAAPTSFGQEAENGSVPGSESLKDKQSMPKSGGTDSTTTKQPSDPLHLKSHSRILNDTTGRKRSVGFGDKPPKLQETKNIASPSPKKLRLSPLKSVAKDEPRSNSTSNGLPALLSPTLPPTSISPRLPQLLSPTLPPDIEEELARLQEDSPVRDILHKRSISATSSTSRDEPSKAKLSDVNMPHSESTCGSSHQHSNTKTRHSLNHDPSTGLKSNIHPDFQELSRTDKSSQATGNRPQSVSASITPKVHQSPIDAKTGLGITTPKQRLIVRLKYGRSNRKRVEALLKFSGKRKFVAGSTLSKSAKDNEIASPRKQDQSDGLVSAVPQGEKRARATEGDEKHETSSKRPRVSANTNPSEKAPTPVPPTFKSPSIQQQPGTAKADFSTPKKDSKGTALRQTDSRDRDAKTPSGLTNKSTPGTTEKATKLSPPPSSDGQTNRSRESERRAWRDEFHKYASLGRELKHAASRHTTAKGAGESITGADEKLAAATAVEAILCFILAFIADDRSRALARQVGDSTAWRSILAYWRVVKQNTAPYPRLHGLCLLLGAVSHDAIHALDLERLAVSSLPGEHSPVPTPGSDGNTVTSDESKKYKMEFLELKTRLPEYYKEAHRLWLEGSRGLSDEVLMQEFPITWSKRSKNFSELGKQRLKIGHYSGDFFLPLGRTTTPLEAVRFGWSILCEWCRKEGVGWEGRLGL
ncbi:hypothetical protein VTN02DRAFT_1553 [Thermoascus thermophilus]